MQNELRKEIKLLKALQSVSYTEIAEYLEIHRNSLYNWLNG
jgi:transposase